MGDNFYQYSQNSYQDHYQYSGPRSYDTNAQFTVDDIGSQAPFSGQYMQRSSSSYSTANSHDSAVDGLLSGQYMYRDNSQSSNSTGYNTDYSSFEGMSPNVLLGQNIQYSSTAVDSYLPQSGSGNEFFAAPYTEWKTPRGNLGTYDPLLVDSPSSPISPGTQPSGMQSSQPPKYCCLERNCNTSFARQADLQRHYSHKHLPLDKQQTWYCDWKTCPRSESGYREALERLGQAPNAQQKQTGMGPFTRKDHYMAHLRDIHQEPIPKRDPKADPGWMSGRIFKPEYWRCGKCLKRVWIQRQRDAGRNEYSCCNCGAPCHQEVMNERARRFASAGGSSAGSSVARGRTH
ncbi:unnamed protein product [Discula destructiva]